MAFRTFLEDCDCAEILANSASMRDPAISELTRRAINIVLLNSILAGLNDTDVYTLDELLNLGKCCTCDISSLDQSAMLTIMLWELAKSVGTISELPGELVNQAVCLNCDPRFFDSILLALICRFITAVNTLGQPV